MTVNKRATCPLCTRTTGTYMHEGRRRFNQHCRADRHNSAEWCESEGWIVEDDELVTVPKSNAGQAQPSHASWHCARNDLRCRRGQPCSDECRILPDPIPTPPPFLPLRRRTPDV